MTAETSQFYKSDFCQTVTGYSDGELRDRVRTDPHIHLIAGPVEQIRDAFERFKDWEREIHPRADEAWKSHSRYWEPAYGKLDEAFADMDEEEITTGIVELVDKILYD